MWSGGAWWLVCAAWVCVGGFGTVRCEVVRCEFLVVVVAAVVAAVVVVVAVAVA